MSGDGKVKVRNIGIVCPGEGAAVWVDHVWDTRPRGHGRRDEGSVGLVMEADGQPVGVVLGPEDGLMLADWIRRAVDLVLEISEDEPETKTGREYQVLSRPRPADENGRAERASLVIGGEHRDGGRGESPEERGQHHGGHQPEPVSLLRGGVPASAGHPGRQPAARGTRPGA